MYEHVKTLLEMAEWLQANGEGELAEQCKATARKILDIVAYAEYVNRQRGACKAKAAKRGAATPRAGKSRESVGKRGRL